MKNIFTLFWNEETYERIGQLDLNPSHGSLNARALAQAFQCNILDGLELSSNLKPKRINASSNHMIHLSRVRINDGKKCVCGLVKPTALPQITFHSCARRA